MSNTFPAKRRLLQYSLRTFLILLTTMCLWLGSKTERVRTQRRIVRLVKEMGGEAVFDYEYSDDPAAPPNPPPGPAPLRMFLGNDYFAELVSVRLEKVTDVDVGQVGEATTLRHLSISGGITDKAMDTICRLTNLESLRLDAGRVTGGGLAKLSELPHLRSLAISNMPISAEGARQVGRLTGLERLSLANTRLTSKLVRHLGHLDKLSTLDLSRTLVGDEGLEDLSQLHHLELIQLEGSMVSNDGIRKLQAALPNAQISSMAFGKGAF